MVYLCQTKNHNLFTFYTSQRRLAVPEALIRSDIIYRYCICIILSFCVSLLIWGEWNYHQHIRELLSHNHILVWRLLYPDVWQQSETSRLFSSSKGVDLPHQLSQAGVHNACEALFSWGLVLLPTSVSQTHEPAHSPRTAVSELEVQKKGNMGKRVIWLSAFTSCGLGEHSP